MNTKKGRRDMFFMILLYDTGARVDEILNVKVCDAKLEGTPTLLLYGKGKKSRHVPLSNRTVSHFKKYMKDFHPDVTDCSKRSLFYGLTGKEHGKMSSNNVRVFLQKHSEAARKFCPVKQGKSSCHVKRYVKAMPYL